MASPFAWNVLNGITSRFKKLVSNAHCYSSAAIIVHSKAKLYRVFFGDDSPLGLAIIRAAANTSKAASTPRADDVGYETGLYKVSTKCNHKYVRSKIHVADASTS